MYSLQYGEHGGPEVLYVAELDVPTPGPEDILIRVKAATLNPTDTKIRTGELKMLRGFAKLPYGMGMDAAGIVEKVGSSVKSFAVGDRVFGMSKDNNAFSDFTLIKESEALRIPDDMTDAQAASIAMSGSTAMIASGTVNVSAEEKVLVLGAAGGIGQFFVQIFAQQGAQVYGLASGKDANIVKKLGAVESFDYHDFSAETTELRFDKIVDTSGKWKADDALVLLTDRGTFYTLTPDSDILKSSLLHLMRAKSVRPLIALAKAKATQELLQLFSPEIPQVIVGAEYPLHDALKVVTDSDEGKLNVKGKIVLEA